MQNSVFKTLAAATALTTLPAWAQEAAKPAPRQPNLLVIHCDQLNFRTLGCYREQLPKEQALIWGDGAVLATPNIDRIAKAGAICNRFYATSPVCTPSRASFLCGRYPQNTGAISNNHPLTNDVVTFAEALRRQGYATGYAGKWHLDGGAKPGWTPKRQFGFEDNTYMFNRGHWKQLADTQAGPKVVGGENAKAAKESDDKSFTTDFLADKAVQFIKDHKQKTFCYMVSFPDPHTPRTVRTPYDAQFKDLVFQTPRTAKEKGEGLPGWGTTLNGKFGGAPQYFGMVKCIDDNVGKILKELETDGLLDHTVIVFTADHGDMCGEHGRNAKGIPEEASAKIPLLISAPGQIKPGTVVDCALNNTDFKPTMLKLLAAPADAKDEGRDASAWLLNQAPKDWQDITFIRIGSDANSGWMGTVTSRYKLVVSPQDTPCLFDLQKDPDELKNQFLVPAYRDTVRELAKALRGYASQRHDPLGQNATIRADLDWAADGTGDYVPAKRTAAKKAEQED
jgi:arylsulfatase A-like enzyme